MPLRPETPTARARGGRRPASVQVLAVPCLAALCLSGLLAGCGASGGDAVADPEPSVSASAPVDDAPADTPDGDAPAGLPRSAATALPEFDARSSVGELAEGFPSDVVPVAPGSEVLASSAGAPGDDGLVPITLNLRTADSVEDVTDFYAGVLDDGGFTVSPSEEASALTALTTFVRTGKSDEPTQSVAVGVFDDDDERLVTISGLVAPA
ncbi:hypothetical protein IF650_18880 [Cellulosimicrobium terreum]|nr:hypothetical protein [Cellulosimicrobium terreum]